MAEKTSVFVSSTRVDLVEFRRAVRDALEQHGFHPVAMENFGAHPVDPVEVCLREVTESEAFVGIYAWRYGYVPRGSRFSITEQEFQEARRRGRPCFCYVVDKSCEWSGEREEGEPALRLEEFKARLHDPELNLTVGLFTSPEGLGERVATDLDRWKKDSAERFASLTPERREEIKLLKKVRNTWTGGLAPLASRIELRRTQASGLARRTLALAGDERPEESWRPLLDVFRAQDALLIKGARGAGKSYTLVELFLDLARFVERDLQQPEPIPVIFNLASWSVWRDGDTLEGWLIDQLGKGGYRRKEKLAQEWLDNERLVLLLDGLSEVAPEKRLACVDAINLFLDDEKHGDTGMVVCCHDESLAKLPLKLQAPLIHLEPLTPAQVADFLGTDPVGTALCAALTRDGREELYRSPLMLTLTRNAFQKSSPEEIAEKLDGSSEPLREVCAGYANAMLIREEMESNVLAAPTQRLLAWLAEGMKRRSLELFQLEQLEPSWLPGAAGRWAYALLSRSAAGVLLVLPMALCWAPVLWLLAGLLGGAFVGALDTIPLKRSSAPARSRAQAFGLAALRLGLIALGTFLLFNLLGALGLGRGRALGANEIRDGLLGGSLLALVFTAVLGWRGLWRDGGNDIQVSESLGWEGWSWRGAMKGGLYGMAALLTIWGINVASVALGAAGTLLQTEGWLVFLVGCGVLGGLAGGVFGGLEGRSVEGKAWPNQGIWLELRNAGLFGLCTLVVAVLVLEAIFWSIAGWGRHSGQGSVFQDDPFVLSWLAPSVGLTCAFWVSLWAGGLDFLQHFSLRLVLGWRTPFPADCVPLLEHAVDRGLLVRRGGSYQFSPNLLRDYITPPARST